MFPVNVCWNVCEVCSEPHCRNIIYIETTVDRHTHTYTTKNMADNNRIENYVDFPRESIRIELLLPCQRGPKDHPGCSVALSPWPVLWPAMQTVRKGIPVNLVVANRPRRINFRALVMCGWVGAEVKVAALTEPSGGCEPNELAEPELDVRARTLPTLVCFTRFGLIGGTLKKYLKKNITFYVLLNIIFTSNVQKFG